MNDYGGWRKERYEIEGFGFGDDGGSINCFYYYFFNPTNQKGFQIYIY